MNQHKNLKIIIDDSFNKDKRNININFYIINDVGFEYLLTKETNKIEFLSLSIF